MRTFFEVTNLSRSYGEKVLFKNISFTIAEGQKVALIARNGTGKTSILNTIAGLEYADEGKAVVFPGISHGYLKQDPELNELNTVFEEVYESANEIQRTILNYEMALETHDKKLLQEATEQMDACNGWEYETRVKQILATFRITNLEQKISELSGGQRKRVALAKTLITEPDFLILDEHTNDLDILTLNVLEEYLVSFNGCVIVVTHDRFFLDKIVDHLFVFKGNAKIKDFPGNYSQWKDWADNQDRKDRAVQKVKEVITEKPPREKKPGLTFKEKRELEQLEIDLERLEKEKADIEAVFNEGSLSAEDLINKSNRLGKIIHEIDTKSERWIELSDLATNPN